MIAVGPCIVAGTCVICCMLVFGHFVCVCSSFFFKKICCDCIQLFCWPLSMNVHECGFAILLLLAFFEILHDCVWPLCLVRIY